MSDEGMQPGSNGLGGSSPVSASSGMARCPSHYIGGDRASYGYRLLSSEAARRLAETLRAGQSTVLPWTCKPPVDAGQSNYTLQTKKYGNTVLNLKPSLTNPWMIPLLALMREAYEDTLRESEDSKGALDAQINQALQMTPGADDEFPDSAISAAAKYLLAKEQMKKTAEVIECTWDDVASMRLAYRLWLQDECGATLRLSEKQGVKVNEWARLTEPSDLYDEMSECGEIYRKT